jgi:hypothetical protein
MLPIRHIKKRFMKKYIAVFLTILPLCAQPERGTGISWV